MNLDDQLHRYFAPPISPLRPRRSPRGSSACRSISASKRIAPPLRALALLHMLGPPHLDIAFKDEADRERALNFMDAADRGEPWISFDLLIVGGGINGAAIARDAAGRGLDVLLVEKDDLAGHTSSASSKLIHGGLRYLEQYEFRLVRESLHERAILLATAPHIVRPLQLRPARSARRPALLAAPPRPPPLRSARRPRRACPARAAGKRRPRSRAAEARLPARRLLGRLGRRCPPGRPQRARRARARRRDRHPHRIRSPPAATARPGPPSSPAAAPSPRG